VRVINITTYTGKKRKLKGTPRSLVLRSTVKNIFDGILEHESDMRFVEASRKIATQLDITDVRVRQILKNDFDFRVTRYATLANSRQQINFGPWENK